MDRNPGLSAEFGHVVGARKEDIGSGASKPVDHRDSSAKDWLKHTTCSHLFPEQRTEIVTVEKDDDIKQAYKQIIDHKILSAPVWDPKHDVYTGFLDVLDVVNYTIHHCGAQALSSPAEFEKLVNSDNFYKEKVSKIAGTSGRNQYFAFQANTPLAIALDQLATNKLHRFAVVESDGNLVSIITASHVVRLLYKHTAKFPISTKRVAEIEGFLKPTLSVRSSQKAFEAFRLICENHISGIAVVDDNGQLIGNISGSDLRQVGYDGKLMTKLLLTVGDFIKLIPKNPTIPGPYAVRTTSTLSDVLSLITETRSHRVYIVDDNKLPIGVISVVDIVAAMIKSVL